MAAPASPASPAPVAPRRRPLVGRVVLWVLGVLLLAIALLLPYRTRIAYADAIGRAMNAAYHAFVRLLRWFLEQLRA